jgi:hypothetical protein
MAGNAISELPPCEITVLLEKLIFAQLIKKCIPFIGSRACYLLHKRLPLVILRNRSQVQFIYSIYLRSTLILFPVYAYIFQMVHSVQIIRPESCINLSITCALYALHHHWFVRLTNIW